MTLAAEPEGSAGVRAREAFNRAAFRGARIERQTRHHRKLRRGDRTTTLPMYGDDIPLTILRRVERDLEIDLNRPVRARRGPRTSTMSNAETIDVDLTRDVSGAWIATVPTISGCHTYGWSISEATKRIREALVLWDADPRLARPRPMPPEDLQRDVESARAALERTDAARADVRREMERLARALT